MTGDPAGVRLLRLPVGRLERNARVVAAAKLINVGLAMLWGFAVTFTFVRLLPIAEFRAFLLLVAFANFTVSADFGFSGIIYARLRRFRLGGAQAGGAEAGGDFHPRDMAVLLAFMMAVVVLGAVLIAGGIATGHIPTQRPGLFLAFYILSAANIFAILVKRAMAALDHNLLWELVDAVRRTLSVALLLLALAGVPVILSVCIQIALVAAALLYGLSVIHGASGMAPGDWLLRGVAWGRVRRSYMADMGTTMALTLSDVAAYTAPYFGIAMMTHDPRPLLIFDFIFKISRALSALVRALSEAVLPRLTAAFHEGRMQRVREIARRLLWGALAAAGALALGLMLAGPMLSRLLFDGKAVLTLAELVALAMLLCGLAVLCVSTYVHNGVGAFARLLPPSLVFLALSVGSVVAAAGLARVLGEPFALCFASLYALSHAVLGLWHWRMLGRLTGPVRKMPA
ncbi:MAG: hypothetical protein ABW048_00060 [Sphingobium sp.]